MNDLTSISDENLYQLCKTYGGRVLLWRQKFIGLLPEVFKRKLFEKKSFSSIFEFAKKLAGLSEEQVRRVLNLEEKFASLPILKSLLVNGEVSANKLMRIASIANTENEIFLAGQVQLLSKSAVETLVRDEKCNKIAGNHYGLSEPLVDVKSVPGHGVNLSPEVQQKLFDLQQKGFDINVLLLDFLEKRDQEIAQQKEQISEKILKKEESKPATRHIPQAVKNILTKEFGKKCSIKACQKLVTQLHHTQRFALNRSHDPRYIAPLCKDHHQLAHTVDARYCQHLQHAAR